MTKGKYPGKWNNPGNVRPGSVTYNGQNGTDFSSSGTEFLKFDTPQHGLEAMGQVIGQISRVKIPEQFREGKLKSDKFTLRNLISIYAPKTDHNDVNGYTKFVSGWTKIDPDQELKTSDVKTMKKVLDAMVRQDSGHPHADWFEDANYELAARKMEVQMDAEGDMTSMYGVPVRRKLYDGEDRFFKTETGKKTAGMLAEDNRIIFNPYFGLDSDGERMLAMNEATRYHLRSMGDKRPTFAITDEQRKFFTGTPYEGHDRDMMDTIIARGVSGDNLKDYKLTDEQKRVVKVMKERLETQQDAEGGDASGSNVQEVPENVNSEQAVDNPVNNEGGPRIAVNPSTFHNQKDGLCIAFNEAYRVVMESNGFEPQSEPTEDQRKFFSDTAYSNDETQLRRTILARICTFDTSVKDPTDEQLQEAVEFLETVMEIGAPQNEWEQSIVQRTRDILQKTLEAHGGREGGTSEPTQEPTGDVEAQAAAKGGEVDEDRMKETQQEQPVTEQQKNPDGSTGNPEFTANAQKPAANPDGSKGNQEFIAANANQADGNRGPDESPVSDRSGKTGIGLVGNTNISLVGKTDIGLVGKTNIETTGMNGPTIEPTRKIGEMGSKQLTNNEMNGPAIEPTRKIGEMGSKQLTNNEMNGPVIEPTRKIGELGSKQLTNNEMNGPTIANGEIRISQKHRDSVTSVQAGWD